MKLRKFFKIIIAVALFGFISINAAQDKEHNTFTFKDLNGKTVVMNTYTQGIHFKGEEGKVVLLDFFGNMCPPCLMEIPELIELQKEFKDKFKIIAFQVQTRATDDEMREFVRQRNINYTVINNSDPKVFDFTDYISAKTSWKGMIPFAILFDTNGDAAKVYLGMKSKKEFERDIEYLLKKK
ncbi:MAG: TlpA family protein disulfide reductase [Epsilonproteobacteria bacterium]|nr:TlpA family protein disulfide reductase [Campylobacterota bacterium]